MEANELETAKGHQEEEVKQFSVFMENKVGRLLDIVKILSAANIHVVALSILDTADSAIVRLVADDPDKARTVSPSMRSPIRRSRWWWWSFRAARPT